VWSKVVKEGAERSEKFSAKHDPDVIMLRIKALQNFSIDKFQIPAQQAYIIDNNLAHWLDVEDLKYGQCGNCYDFLRKIVWKWTLLTDYEKDILLQEWLAKGLPQSVWDKIDAKATEIHTLYSFCNLKTSKMFCLVEVSGLPRLEEKVSVPTISISSSEHSPYNQSPTIDVSVVNS
jgi:hypothetical protein